MAERPTALRLGILVFDGVMMSSIAAPSDALRVADRTMYQVKQARRQAQDALAQARSKAAHS